MPPVSGTWAQLDVHGSRQGNHHRFILTSIIDGDTVRVSIGGKIEKVRLIGVNAPELGDSRARVRCFAYAAKWFAREKLQGLTVTLESDPTQADRDRYGRLLRYAFWNNGNFNLYIIKQGFAYEYTYNRPYRYQEEFKDAQQYAEGSKWGLWDPKECS